VGEKTSNKYLQWSRESEPERKHQASFTPTNRGHILVQKSDTGKEPEPEEVDHEEYADAND
jgi:hypothetical protein